MKDRDNDFSGLCQYGVLGIRVSVGRTPQIWGTRWLSLVSRDHFTDQGPGPVSFMLYTDFVEPVFRSFSSFILLFWRLSVIFLGVTGFDTIKLIVSFNTVIT